MLGQQGVAVALYSILPVVQPGSPEMLEVRERTQGCCLLEGVSELLLTTGCHVLHFEPYVFYVILVPSRTASSLVFRQPMQLWPHVR